MSIDRIGQYGGLYNRYPIEPLPRISAEDVKRQEEQSAQQPIQQQGTEYVSENYASTQEPDTRSRMADLDNIYLTFNENETFDYIGQDAGLENLDIMSAISDMQKDEILQQYQYFVGPKELNAVVASTPDGIVIQK